MASVFNELSSSVERAASLAQNARISDEERSLLLVSINKLKAAIETPPSLFQDVLWGGLSLLSIQVLINLGVFDAFSAVNHTELSLDEIISKCKGDRDLLLRFLRHAASEHIFDQVSADKWIPTSFRQFISEPIVQSITLHFYDQLKARGTIVEFLQETNYAQPSDVYNGPWQRAYHTKQTYFEWLAERPLAQQAFNDAMTIKVRATWFEAYPVEQKLTIHHSASTSSSTCEDRVLLVDLGGNTGRDIRLLKKHFPKLQGKIILQELPQVIADIDEPLPDGVSAQAHDFFTPQPIKGAKAYYMQAVLHDWPDLQARQIIANIAAAMADDSLLLLYEWVVPDAPPVPSICKSDLVMLTFCASLERDKRQWIELVAAAGLRVTKFYYLRTSQHRAVIECVKA